MPAYFANDNRLSGFQVVNETEENDVDRAFRVWSANSLDTSQIRPTSNPLNADVMVFKAALTTDDPFLAFPHGDGEGGDIIINTNSSIMQNLSPRSQGYFELLRATGIVLGLKETTDFGRHETVMGRRTGEDVDKLPWASTPLPLDFRAARHRDNRYLRFGGFANELSVSNLAEPFQTIGAPQGSGAIRADESSLPWIMDLRPGSESYAVTEDGSQPYKVSNSYSHLFADARGSEFDDVLTGNHLSNDLFGLGGNDVLTGNIGEDTMKGGHGDDLYIQKVGHARPELVFHPEFAFDTIDDRTTTTADSSGVDELRIEGMFDFDRLQDLTFQRQDELLNIRLDYEQTPHSNMEMIQIRNMNSANNRIEKLTLANPDGDITTISLVSAFTQTGDHSQRFQLTEGSDSFGRLVAPV